MRTWGRSGRTASGLQPNLRVLTVQFRSVDLTSIVASIVERAVHFECEESRNGTPLLRSTACAASRCRISVDRSGDFRMAVDGSGWQSRNSEGRGKTIRGTQISRQNCVAPRGSLCNSGKGPAHLHSLCRASLSSSLNFVVFHLTGRGIENMAAKNMAANHLGRSLRTQP